MSHATATGPIPAGLATPEERVEGRAKVTGVAAYAADQHLPGTLHARFLRSAVPHARIVRLETAAARAVPGVRAVLTGQDIGLVRHGRRLMDWPVLAVDRVRFVGDRIAAVAAETIEAADEALRLLDVELAELPAVLDAEAALAGDAPVLHPESGEYVYIGGPRPAVPHPNVQGVRVVRRDDDDIEAVFASAHRVFEHRFTTPHQHPGYIEPHATVVWIDEQDVVHVITGNKAPFSLRSQMEKALGIPAARIEIHSGYIGGDFGGKGLSVDEYGCYFLARATGRPVRAVTSYNDELRGTNLRHAGVITLRTAVDADGRFVAHHARAIFDGGAYAAAKPLPHLTLAGGIATLSAYRVPHVRLEVTTVYTNHPPAGHVRSPGEVQALFAGESQVDIIARELGWDPLHFRLHNAVREGDVGLAGEHFREARAVEILEALRHETGWDERLRGEGTGWGISLGVRHIGGGKAIVRMRLEPDGTLDILTGSPDQGAGSATVVSRVAQAALGIAAERIRVRMGSTREAPVDPGVGGSRVTHIASRAVQDGAVKLRDAIEAHAASVFAGGGRLEHGRLLTADGRSYELAVALPRIAPDGIEVEGTYEAGAHGHDEPGDFDFAGYAIEVAVDRGTGQIDVRSVVLAADVGTIINPVAHRGQLLGGFAFGLGAALMEELVIEDGAVVSGTLGDVKLPTAIDVPPVRVVLLPTTTGPGAFGAKMAGELTNAPVAPAIANAVADAVGVRVVSLPISAQKVYEGLRDRQR